MFRTWVFDAFAARVAAATKDTFKNTIRTSFKNTFNPFGLTSRVASCKHPWGLSRSRSRDLERREVRLRRASEVFSLYSPEQL